MENLVICSLSQMANTSSVNLLDCTLWLEGILGTYLAMPLASSNPQDMDHYRQYQACPM